MANKIDIKKLGKVKDALQVLGKRGDMDYPPLTTKAKDNLKKGREMEIDVALNELPRSVEEGVTPAQRDLLLKIADKKLAIARKLKMGNK